jgi:hypothetical protein
MPLLQVRDFPAELYDTISRVARSENRSVPQQTIVLLKTALNLTEERKTLRKAVLQEIDCLNIENTNNFPPPEEITREDRDE